MFDVAQNEEEGFLGGGNMLIKTLSFWGMMVIWSFGVAPDLNGLGLYSPVSSFVVGEASTAVALGVDSPYKNPAGLSSVQDVVFTTTASTYFDQNMSVYALGVAKRLTPAICVGFALPYQSISDIPQTVELSDGHGLQTGSFQDNTVACKGILSYTTHKLSMGVGFGYDQASILGITGQGFGIDLGVLAESGDVSIGSAIQNLGGKLVRWSSGQTDTIDPVYHVGLGCHVLSNFQVLLDTSMEKKSASMVNIGCIYGFHKVLSLSFGWVNVGRSPDLRAGMKVNLPDFSLEYGCSTMALGTTQRLGLSWFFDS